MAVSKMSENGPCNSNGTASLYFFITQNALVVYLLFSVKSQLKLDWSVNWNLFLSHETF